MLIISWSEALVNPNISIFDQRRGRMLLLHACAEEVVSHIKIQPIREYLEAIIREKLAM